MGGQGNRPQMKEQEKSPEEEHSGREASKSSDTEFKVMVVRMLTSTKKDTATMKKMSQEEYNI